MGKLKRLLIDTPYEDIVERIASGEIKERKEKVNVFNTLKHLG